MHCGYTNSIGSGYWNGLIGSDANGYIVGKRGNYFRMTNLLFDQSTLASLRSKTVTSIKLKLTLASSAHIRPSTWTVLPIGYKLNATATTDSSGEAWTRSDADSTTEATTTVGYIRSSGSAYDASAGDVLTITMSGKVPVYGYVLGATNDASEYYSLYLSAAQLEVVTNETLTLAYNANGGSGAPSSSSKNGTPNATFTVSSTTPTRTGYTFSGWNTKADGTGTNYAAGSSITLSVTGTTTLYAKWTAKTYTVTYNVNGGSGSVSSQTKTYGVTLTLRTYSGTKTGYNFLGWAESASATAAAYSSGGTFTKNADTTLYAVWSANSYAVTYYGNASDATNVPAAQTKTHGVNLTLTSSKPSRTGYTFSKWNTNSGGTGTNYASGATYTGNANLSLYAVWTPNTYTVSFNANGGSGAPAAQTKTYNVSLTLSSTVPTRAYYTFLGWATSASATTATYSPGGAFTTNANTTLYAVWRKNRVNIKYNANGGSMAVYHGAAYEVGGDGYVTKNGNAAFHFVDFDATDDPYNIHNINAIFLANSSKPAIEPGKEWNSAADGSGTSFDESEQYAWGTLVSCENGDATYTLYADWRSIYQISYNLDGGSWTAPSTQGKIQGIDLVLYDEVPTKTSYEFLYWMDANNNHYNPGDTYTADAAATLTAVWQLIALDQYDCYVIEDGSPVGCNVYVVEGGVPVAKDFYVK